jgi:hypothetical protein
VLKSVSRNVARAIDGKAISIGNNHGVDAFRNVTQCAVRDDRIHLVHSIICCRDIGKERAGATGLQDATGSELPLPQAHWQISVDAWLALVFE